MRAAKAELLASIEELNSSQQFHIVFYNHQTMLFRPTIDRPQIVVRHDGEQTRGPIFCFRNAGGRRHQSCAGAWKLPFA